MLRIIGWWINVINSNDTFNSSLNPVPLQRHVTLRQALRAASSALNFSMTSDIQNTVPVLPSLDLQQSVDFYTAKLGFREVGRYPTYAIVSRDGCEIHFWHCGDDCHLAENSSCYIRANTQKLYQEFKANGLDIEEPAAREWGMKELYVIDPHGNLLKFGESV